MQHLTLLDMNGIVWLIDSVDFQRVFFHKHGIADYHFLLYISLQLDVSYNQISGISPTCFYGTRLGKTENSALSLQGNRIETMDACTLQVRNLA